MNIIEKYGAEKLYNILPSLNHYVYGLIRKDGRPFYIGKGSGDRILYHEKFDTPYYPQEVYISQLLGKGEKLYYFIFEDFETNEEALEYELQLQRKYKLVKDGGCLLNSMYGQPWGDTSFKGIEQFVDEAEQIHGTDYLYSEYKGYRVKVPILCMEYGHGIFYQSPDNHLSGHGCPKCAGTVKRDFTQFVIDACEVHGDKYRYLKTGSDLQGKVNIICPKHGKFSIRPRDHIQGQGCPKCGYESSAKKRTKPFKQLIEEFNEVHNGRYLYTVFGKYDDKIPIECMEEGHGTFYQRVGHHLNGTGCPKCGRISQANKIRKHK